MIICRSGSCDYAWRAIFLLCTSWIIEPFGEIGTNFSLQLSSRTQFAKISNKKVIGEIQCKKHKNKEFMPPLRYLFMYSKTCVKQPLSNRPQIGFQDKLSLDADQKYCRMLPLSTFIKQPFVITIFIMPPP